MKCKFHGPFGFSGGQLISKDCNVFDAHRFEYEYRNKEGQWFRAYGNENWEFDENGLMKKRYASINDLEIKEADRYL
ncbi:DUF1348 family protein [Parasegetibacter sp. NRK P23]|uniref:DUF1348 family protein n=1 Tax=Parasegetibacter sp. NRK P23 TaxID=2942999 RepID=UPI002044422B|nr:DUF1348 family protein [Parasegetibacter sp. NRK P23]MCM5528358.1 nuclear transport factor 2 family protein [Parasegetibacter sp. NRK P23]